MIRISSFAMWSMLISLVACQHGAAPPAVAPPLEPPQAHIPFEATGRILVRGPIQGPSASFDDNRVIGPTINVSRRPDGTWAGWIRGRAVNLDVKEGEISGASLTLNVQELPEGIEVRGLWVGGVARSQEISIRVTPTEFYARQPYIKSPIYLEGAGPGLYGKGAYANSVELEGAAALSHPPEPQFALALIAAL